MNNELLLQILELVLKINAATKHNAHFNYAGHVGSISIHFDVNGYKENGKVKYICTSEILYNDELKEVIEILKKVLLTGNLDYLREFGWNQRNI